MKTKPSQVIGGWTYQPRYNLSAASIHFGGLPISNNGRFIGHSLAVFGRSTELAQALRLSEDGSASGMIMDLGP